MNTNFAIAVPLVVLSALNYDAACAIKHACIWGSA